MINVWTARAGYGIGVILIALGVGLVFSLGWALMSAGVGLIVYALVIHDVDTPGSPPT